VVLTVCGKWDDGSILNFVFIMTFVARQQIYAVGKAVIVSCIVFCVVWFVWCNVMIET
jgi:hypothetical protein